MDEKWLDKLWPFLSSSQMTDIFTAIKKKKTFKIIYPEFKECFRAFKETPFDDVRVVIVTNGPHTDGTANGLAISAKHTGAIAPDILAEALFEVERTEYDGLNFNVLDEWDLTKWANQGVLLLNTALTTEKKSPGSHDAMWEPFMSNLFEVLTSNKTGLLYIFLDHVPEDNIINFIKPDNYLWFIKGIDKTGLFSNINEYISRQQGPEFKIKW